MSSSETVPRTANLLACRQWWKVCFLHGNQEKYYRQVYGRAASQRLAQTRVIYPTKTSEPVVINGSPPPPKQERTVPNSRVTVLDDPFLFGLDNESDSGIEATRSDPPKPILKHRISEPLAKINSNRRTGICDVSGIVENAIENNAIESYDQNVNSVQSQSSSEYFKCKRNVTAPINNNNNKQSPQLQVNRTSRLE